MNIKDTIVIWDILIIRSGFPDIKVGEVASETDFEAESEAKRIYGSNVMAVLGRSVPFAKPEEVVVNQDALDAVGCLQELAYAGILKPCPGDDNVIAATAKRRATDALEKIQ